MLFTLAFDHRNWLMTKFFGVSGQPTAAEQARAREAKQLIFDGLLTAVGDGGLREGEAAALVDDEYGAAVVDRAKDCGIPVALAVERSGERELAWQHEPLHAALDKLDPDYAKVLVRYNPDGDAGANARQRRKLHELQEWCVGNGVSVMLELLVPPELSQLVSLGDDRDTSGEQYEHELRPGLIERSVRELVEDGLEPELWKLEAMSSRAQYAAVAAAAAAAERPGDCLVLGAAAPPETVAGWLATAASVEGFGGFAVGRTLWADAVRANFAGTLPRDAASRQIAHNYLRFVETYLAGRAATAAAPVGAS